MLFLWRKSLAHTKLKFTDPIGKKENSGAEGYSQVEVELERIIEVIVIVEKRVDFTAALKLIFSMLIFSIFF